MTENLLQTRSERVVFTILLMNDGYVTPRRTLIVVRR